MKRLLFITGGVHYPPSSGYGLRVYNLLKIYSKIFEVTLIADSYNAKNENEIRAELRSLTKDFYFVERHNSFLGDFRQYIHPTQPKMVSLMTTPELRSTISDVIRKSPTFDFIHVQRLRMVEGIRPFLKGEQITKFIFDLDDWESKTRLREVKTIRSGGLLKRIKRNIEVKRLYYYEKKVLPLFDWVYVCSEIDREALSKEFRLNNLVVVPNGITWPENLDCRYKKSNLKGKVLLYLGSLGYGPNIDAIQFFVKEVFPLILSSEPDAKLWIAGSTQGAPNYIIELAQNPSIRVLGFVEDLEQLYAKANVVIVPLRLGGGTRVKILEAASLKKAIVSTKIGCEGLEFEDGRDILIASDPAAFSRACIYLLTNSEGNFALGQSASKVVKEKYRWSVIEKDLVKLFLNDIA